MVVEVHTKAITPYTIVKSFAFYHNDLDELRSGVELPAVVDPNFQEKVEFLHIEWKKSR